MVEAIHPETADPLGEQGLRHGHNVVEAKGAALRHAVLLVQDHLGGYLTDRARGWDGQDSVEDGDGSLAGED
jgi:hypothetical protein